MATPPVRNLVTAPQLGLLLKGARHARNLTQAQVAGRLRISQRQVSYLELHPEKISFAQLLSWCAFVGLQLAVEEREGPPTEQPEW